MAKSFGYMPATQEFVPASEWKQFRFPLAAFNKTEGYDVLAVIFAGGRAPGPFRFENRRRAPGEMTGRNLYRPAQF